MLRLREEELPHRRPRELRPLELPRLAAGAAVLGVDVERVGRAIHEFAVELHQREHPRVAVERLDRQLRDMIGLLDQIVVAPSCPVR